MLTVFGFLCCCQTFLQTISCWVTRATILKFLLVKKCITFMYYFPLLPLFHSTKCTTSNERSMYKNQWKLKK